MNREDAATSLQIAINYLVLAVAAILSVPSVPQGTKTIRLDDGAVTILADGTVIYSPGDNQSIPNRLKGFSIADYTAIVSPSYPPVQRIICPCCKGSGELAAS